MKMQLSLSRTLLLLFSLFFCAFSSNAQNETHSSEDRDEIADTTFVNLRDYSKDFVYDMKYATEDNFLKAKVYDCAECLLRYKTVKALIAANHDFMKNGCKIKLFDCYRPLSIQKKMWEIVSNPEYVADPKKGSIHNKGGAVDITLVNAKGEELEMGTNFDFFGIQASHNYKKFPVSVRANRKYLKSVMIKNGFNSFDSEWWHYNLKTGLNDKVSNQKWKCD
ncbi:M15 family metallopeptidase [Flavobacterium collinsii]|nr:M15 family metallopeptidase [Flavobacterium collinsii]